jgi:hypothetical protein
VMLFCHYMKHDPSRSKCFKKMERMLVTAENNDLHVLCYYEKISKDPSERESTTSSENTRACVSKIEIPEEKRAEILANFRGTPAEKEREERAAAQEARMESMMDSLDLDITKCFKGMRCEAFRTCGLYHPNQLGYYGKEIIGRLPPYTTKNDVRRPENGGL